MLVFEGYILGLTISAIGIVIYIILTEIRGIKK